MAANYRFAFHPRWLAGHILVLAAAAVMVLLGHWQLTISEKKGFDLQNFGYAFQWWAFAIFAVVLWVRIVRDKTRGIVREAPEPRLARQEHVPYRRYVMPTLESTNDDPELARYNAYLAQLSDDKQ